MPKPPPLPGRPDVAAHVWMPHGLTTAAKTGTPWGAHDSSGAASRLGSPLPKDDACASARRSSTGMSIGWAAQRNSRPGPSRSTPQDKASSRVVQRCCHDPRLAASRRAAVTRPKHGSLSSTAQEAKAQRDGTTESGRCSSASAVPHRHNSGSTSSSGGSDDPAMIASAVIFHGFLVVSGESGGDESIAAGRSPQPRTSAANARWTATRAPYSWRAVPPRGAGQHSPTRPKVRAQSLTGGGPASRTTEWPGRCRGRSPPPAAPRLAWATRPSKGVTHCWSSLLTRIPTAFQRPFRLGLRQSNWADVPAHPVRLPVTGSALPIAQGPRTPLAAGPRAG